MTVFYNGQDPVTATVLEYFGRISVNNVRWNWHELPQEKLFRRSIGRNIAALATSSDWIWFADADMCFRDDCLDTLAAVVSNSTVPLTFPRRIRISETHEKGDRILDKVLNRPCVVDIDPTEFVPHRFRRAIGGVQICRGDVARELGYNRNSSRFQRPVSRWHRCHDDVAFRRSIGAPGAPIDLPGVYRIRHRRYGRFLANGHVVHEAINGAALE